MQIKNKIENISSQKMGTVEILIFLLNHLKNLVQADSMHILGLNASRLDQYLSFLVDRGFVKTLKDGEEIVNFETTDKGKKFLRDYSRLQNILAKGC